MKKIVMFTMVAVVAMGTTTTASSYQYSFASEMSQQVNTSEDSALSLQNGKIFIDGELVHDGFSVMQSEFNFIYFYVPEKGLFTISNREFKGAGQSGSFDGKKLSFDVEGVSVEVKSDTAILSKGRTDAWIKLDREFKLNTDAVIVGYGSDEETPYKWKTQMKFPD